MKIQDIDMKAIDIAIQSLKGERDDNDQFNAGMYYIRDLIEPYYNNLIKENKRLKEELKSIKSNYKIQLEYDENLQERIDEAIDYLQQEGVCIMNKGMNEKERLVWNWHDYYYLLDILKGELE